ncbi:hypothetical protein N7492_002574 [Penicillium capsulatum]|uniref:Phenol 2-monooxygenase n=1 Tax=Penicillium capsulatum TaxID=69766 RepID=A0A9W9LW55_9EURO|nr:hypothetical protein N7492_002574 [Penicillium capsulatum]KAJ6122824.1 hypothetical protein N7512_005289 [Penicillium capsulatum]
MSEHKIPVSKTDVLIVGAGPAGLMTAYWMARCGVRARVIDKRPTKVFLGKADGLRMRTLEIFDSMGFQHRVMQEGHVAVEANFWVSDKKNNLVREAIMTSKAANKSPHHSMLLTQGRLERFILDTIRQYSDLEVERSTSAETFEYDEALEDDHNAYPITVKVQTVSTEADDLTEKTTNGSEAEHMPSGLDKSKLSPDDWNDFSPQDGILPGKTEIIKARYLIGCDGAHSWTRKQVNIPMEGSSTDHIWGVIDVVPISNFRSYPESRTIQAMTDKGVADIRRLSIVTNTAGTILVIPRERRLVRLYVPVQTIEAVTSGRFDRSTVTLDMIRMSVQNILCPYTFDFEICDWWTVYQVGQRIAPTFIKGNRVFLAGDAVHTHSPKAGLGMNMSMQDGFNIGWKVALVAAGVANPLILSTYNDERHRLAEMLLDFDRHWSGHFTNNTLAPEEASTKAEKMRRIAELFEDFADGARSFYGASPLVWKTEGEAGPPCALSLIPGERFPAAKLRKQADGNVQWTTRLMESDGRFRLVILAGDIRDPTQRGRVESLGRFLQDGNKASAKLEDRYLPTGPFDSLIDVLTIHSSPWRSVEYFDFPESLRSFDPRTGWVYDSIWCDDSCSWDRECDGTGYGQWGVDRVHGAMLIVRPDQYIGWVGELDAVDEMTRYLDGFLMAKNESNNCR